MFVTDARI